MHEAIKLGYDLLYKKTEIKRDVYSKDGSAKATKALETLEAASECEKYAQRYAETGPAATGEAAFVPLPGPLGSYINVRIRDDSGTRVKHHEVTVIKPLHAWFMEYERKTRSPRTLLQAIEAADMIETATSKNAQTDYDRGINRCPQCNTILCERGEGVLVCPRDGYVTQNNVEMSTEGLAYEDRYEMTVTENNQQQSGYLRVVHFMETLRQTLGIEATIIPKVVLDTVREEWQKRPYFTKENMRAENVRHWLQIHRFDKWLDHSQRILFLVTNNPFPEIREHEIHHLRELFIQLEVPFLKRPQEITSRRNNFLKYEYVIFKLCEMCEYTHLLSYFSLLKDTRRLEEHDAMWKFFCDELDWVFIPTVY